MECQSCQDLSKSKESLKDKLLLSEYENGLSNTRIYKLREGLFQTRVGLCTKCSSDAVSIIENTIDQDSKIECTQTRYSSILKTMRIE